MPSAPQACIKTIRLCILMAAEYGLSTPELLAEYGIAPALLADPYARVPHALVARLWREIPPRTGDEAFGVRTARRFFQQTLDAFDGAIRHCGSVGEAMGLLSRYARLMHEGAVIEIERTGDTTRCSQRFVCVPEMPRQFCEMVIGMWVLRVKHLHGLAPPLRAVTLSYPSPPDGAEHERCLGTKIQFGAAQNGVLIDQAILDAPVMAPDPTLSLVLARHLEDELARLPPSENDFLATAYRAIRDALVDPTLDPDRLARRLGVSSRTLQRRLQLADTSFSALCEKARRELALHNLRDPKMTLAEVAFLSGYAEISSFFRAFRRWTGQTPREYRAT